MVVVTPVLPIATDVAEDVPRLRAVVASRVSAPEDVVIDVAPFPVKVFDPEETVNLVVPPVINLSALASVVPSDASVPNALPFCKNPNAPIMAGDAGICTSRHLEITAS